ncbi:MAG: FUSC family protein [Micromonosporaceae bacterium]|jgi:uncharacterized membrane protein YgaE (UPF0421/DUF939 family)|nr:FUSC family protein [Micromonosporaceae bacterium]
MRLRWIAAARARAVAFGHEHMRQYRTNVLILAQAGLAAALAWLAARTLHTRDPFFASIVALGPVVSSQVRRLTRTAQLVGGVVLGVGVGEAFILYVGTGAWQIGVSVVAALGLALAVKGGTTLMYQAGATAILIAALPRSLDIEFPRLINAALGGAVGLVVVILFHPLDPVRTARRAAPPLLAMLADRLSGSAEALAARDVVRAASELDEAQQLDPQLERLHETVEEARDVISLAPAHWQRRQAFEQYERTVDHIDHAVRNCQALFRRMVTAIEDREPIPEQLPSALRELGEGMRLMNKEFAAGRIPARARDMVLRAVHDAGEAYAEGLGFSGNVVVAQVRTAGTDLLRASGVEDDEANRMVRRAVGPNVQARTDLPRV